MKTPQLKAKIARLEKELDEARKRLLMTLMTRQPLLPNWLKVGPMPLMQTPFRLKKW